MKLGTASRWLARGLTALVLVASGTYLLVYLYRWEWNRALTAGVFFLAAELAVIGAGINRRLDRIAHRLETGDPAPSPPEASAAVHTLATTRAAATSRPRFSWLDPKNGNLNVFVPVLLGAGVILSGLAYVVERVAGATAGTAMDRSLAGRLDAIAVPASGLVGLGPVPLAAQPAGTSLRTRVTAVAVAAGLVAGTWMAIDAIGDLTQDRPSRYDRSRATVVDLSFSFRDQRSVEVTTDALWASCRDRLPEVVQVVELTAVGPRHARLVVHPALGEHAVRRFRGCLGDVNLSRVLASVEDLRHVPFTPAAAGS